MIRIFALALGAMLAADIASAQTVSERVEKRAACITNEGADLPGPGAATRPAGPPVPTNPECAAAVLDGTSCDSLEDQAGAAQRACLIREIAVWDGVLDRLLPLLADRGAKHGAVKTAIAVFRNFRDKACQAYRVIAVNTPSPDTILSCRLRESVRFTQNLYVIVFSP